MFQSASPATPAPPAPANSARAARQSTFGRRTYSRYNALFRNLSGGQLAAHLDLDLECVPTATRQEYFRAARKRIRALPRSTQAERDAVALAETTYGKWYRFFQVRDRFDAKYPVSWTPLTLSAVSQSYEHSPRDDRP